LSRIRKALLITESDQVPFVAIPSYRDYEFIRDGFSCSHGRFHAQPGDVERVEVSSLRRMFLPKLTREGSRQINAASSDSFVRGQLKHYSVQFDESQISGSGTLLMKKVLLARKCDKVPDHIAKLREQMHAEWLNRCTPEQLSSYPDWVLEKYFLSSGQPEPTKTTTVVGIPFGPYSSYRSGQMREAASEVAGLHQKTGFGPKTQTIFMGWDSVAVGRAAKGHAAKEAKEFQAKEDEREAERVEMHTSYLNTLKRKKGPKGTKTYSPVGSYIINCKELEEGWLDQPHDLSLDIRQTKEPGIFEASFDFGVLEGVMIISVERNILEQYCSQLDVEDESRWDEYWNEKVDEDEDEEKDEDKDENENNVESDRNLGSKRKAEAPCGSGRLAKVSKCGAAQPRTYLLRLKCRETGEGEIQHKPEKGSIKFKDQNLAGFIAKANLPCVGHAVPFTGRKISDTPSSSRNSWADYSARAHGYARVGRWK
jgi:hypothetical protein